jgi:hypothetical protein
LAQQAGSYNRAANSFSPFRSARQPLGGYENLALQKRNLTVFRPPNVIARNEATSLPNLED